MKFRKLSMKHKVWFVLNQLCVILSMVLAGVIAFNITGQTVQFKDSLSVGIGGFVILIVVILGLFNRIKVLFKIRFMGLLTLFVVLLLLDAIIPTAIIALGLVIIPIAIDDIYCKNKWLNIWDDNYEE